MVVDLNLALTGYPVRECAAEEELRNHTLQADVELVLAYDRKNHQQGFIDSLRLDLSDTVNKEPFRRNALQNVHLKYVSFNPFVADIKYFSLESADFQRKFFKQHDGTIYAADMDRVIEAGEKIVMKLESILEGRFIIDASIDRLDYFFNTTKDGSSIAEFRPFYNTNYRREQDFRRWLDFMKGSSH